MVLAKDKINKRKGSDNTGSKKSINNRSSDYTVQIIEVSILAILLFVVFYSPFLRGLYFESEQLYAESFIFFSFLLFCIYKYLINDKRFLVTTIDYAAFGFVIVYFIVIFNAAGTRPAINEWIKYCMFFAVFFMGSELINTAKRKRIALWIVVLSAMGVSLLGIDAIAGENIAKSLNAFFAALGTNIKFFGLLVDGRVYSTIQYPNALGGYLAAVFFICLGLGLSAKNLWTKAATAGINFILLSVLILTISRGAYIVLAAVLLAYIAILPKGNKIKACTYSIASILPSLYVSAKLLNMIQSKSTDYTKAWILVLLGFLGASLILLVMNYLTSWLEKLSWKVYAITAAGLVVIISISTVVLLNSTEPLGLSHSDGEADGAKAIQRNIVLKPGLQYKLQYTVESKVTSNKPEAYMINVFNRDMRGVIIGQNMLLSTYSGKETKGAEKRELVFNVPLESKVVILEFVNMYSGTSAKLYDAQIIDANSNKIIVKLPLKYKYLPELIASRLDEMKVSQNAIIRGIFYKDGIKMIKDHLILGSGGGAWPLIYFSYQSYMYWSKTAHSYPIQIAVECGILGMILLLALVFSILVYFLLEKRREYDVAAEEKITQATVLVSAVALLAHASIDFDFSLSAIFLIFWLLLAIYNGRYRENKNYSINEQDTNFIKMIYLKIDRITYVKKLNAHPIFLAVILIPILLTPILQVKAASYQKEALNLAKAGDINKAESLSSKAVNLDPFNPTYKINHARVLLSKKSLSSSDKAIAENEMKSAESLAKNDSNLLTGIGQYYFQVGDLDKGFEVFERAIKLRPFDPKEWENLMDAYRQVYEIYYAKGQDKEADKYFEKVLSTVNWAKEVNKKNLDPFVFNAKTSEYLERVMYLKENVKDREKALKGNIVFYNMPDLDLNQDNIPDQWTLYTRDGIQIRNDDNKMIVESKKPEPTNYIESRALSLIPGKKYRIEVELANSQSIKTIPYLITGVNKQAEVLKPSGNVYSADVSVPADMKYDSPALIIYIKGKYEIKSIKIIAQ